ncbi:MAG: helix-turn-helix domain-containing protein [Tannerella sp.]|jgi:AraC-like DNA-binding protein|nr:helix-turn-helix domain-containing protein [Tannerella sp.]
MSNILTNELALIKDAITSYDNYQDNVIIIEFDNTSSSFELKNFAASIPSRFDAMILISLSDGEMEIQIDYVTYKACKNSLTLIMPTHITHFIGGNDHLKGWVLAISKSFLQAFPNKQHLPNVISYMQFKKNPLTYFGDIEYKSIYSSLDSVRNKMRQHAHLFYNELIKNALKMFFLDLGNVYLSKKERFTPPTLSRREELFVDFLALLQNNCKKQHDVKFYANELCITTQYLSSILKKDSGKSASQWIQEALMIEARGMLKTPRINVQQVANELNFPDQSTFGKFFKKHTGMSPMTFRKS